MRPLLLGRIMIPSPASRRGFTLIDVAMAIALVVIGIGVVGLSYAGYRDWGLDQARRTNAQNLVNAVLQARAQGVSVDGNGNTFPLVVTLTRANQIYAQISGSLTVVNGTVQIVPVGFAITEEEVLPVGWVENSPGSFGPIP